MKEKISSFGAGLFQKPSESVRREIDRINTKRLMVAAVIMMTINGVSFFLLSTQKVEATQLVQTWREGVLRSHGILFFVNAAIGLSAYFLRDKEHLKRLRRALPYVALIGILASGGVITIFDQCITANITPFVITSIGGAAIFILEPLLVSLIFGLHFVIFTFQMNAFESTVESSMHLSNQINSFSTVAISIGISIIFWYYNQLNFHQQELIKQQQAVLVEKNIQLMRQAHFDSLTGLCNRRHFVDKAETEIKRIQSCRESCCLLVLDIDDFKHINDMHGHPAGDSVLKKLSDLLIHQFRKTDWVGRMGGEEFAVILSGAEFEEAKKVADKVRRQIEQTVFEIEDKKIKITVSVGIAPINEETENFDDVYKKADQALYHAKEYGKNQVVVV